MNPGIITDIMLHWLTGTLTTLKLVGQTADTCWQMHGALEKTVQDSPVAKRTDIHIAQGSNNSDKQHRCADTHTDRHREWNAVADMKHMTCHSYGKYL